MQMAEAEYKPENDLEDNITFLSKSIPITLVVILSSWATIRK